VEPLDAHDYVPFGPRPGGIKGTWPFYITQLTIGVDVRFTYLWSQLCKVCRPTPLAGATFSIDLELDITPKT